MSPPTFRQWFRCWASHQNIEFREQCPQCRDNIEVVGCDGTAIGIQMSNADVDPIEKTHNDVPVPAKHRRHQRCFLTNEGKASKDTKTKIRASREHLRGSVFSHTLTLCMYCLFIPF